MSSNSHTQPAEITCHWCGAIDTPNVERGPFGPHAAKAVCRHCETFLRWVSDKTPEQRQAARRAAIERWMTSQPATAEQLAKLREYGAVSQPASMLAASHLIAVLVRGERGAS